MNKEQQKLLSEAYENFIKSHTGKDDEIILPPFDYINDDGNLMSKNQFITNIKYDYWFSEKWGLKIEERELSLEERYELVRVNGLCPKYSFDIEDGKPVPNKLSEKEWYDNFDIPTKLIKITYNNIKLETYE